MKPLSESSCSCSDNSFILDGANRYGARAMGAALGIKSIWNSTGRAKGRPNKSLRNTSRKSQTIVTGKVPYLVALVAFLSTRAIVIKMALGALGQVSPILLPFTRSHIVDLGDILPLGGLLLRTMGLKISSDYSTKSKQHLTECSVETRARSLHVPSVILVRTVASVYIGGVSQKGLINHGLNGLWSHVVWVGVVKRDIRSLSCHMCHDSSKSQKTKLESACHPSLVSCLPSLRESLPSVFYAYGQSLEALPSQPAASESESRVTGVVSE
nr:hypothetical protein [Tanacetum cinerariifolium]